MMQTIIQLLSGALGCIGFGLLFHLNRRYLPAAGVGGLLAWLAYLLAAPAVHGTFLANLVGGVCAALYAEFMARWYNAPSTPFFITAAVPLIPGSTLYYCMNAVRLQQSAGRGALWRADLFSRIRHCRRHGHCLVPGRSQPASRTPCSRATTPQNNTERRALLWIFMEPSARPVRSFPRYSRWPAPE